MHLKCHSFNCNDFCDDDCARIECNQIFLSYGNRNNCISLKTQISVYPSPKPFFVNQSNVSFVNWHPTSVDAIDTTPKTMTKWNGSNANNNWANAMATIPAEKEASLLLNRYPNNGQQLFTLFTNSVSSSPGGDASQGDLISETVP